MLIKRCRKLTYFFTIMAMGDYLIGPNIGEGSFGHVVYAVHKSTQRKVAIKVIDAPAVRPGILNQSKQHTAMIWNERHILSLPELKSSPWIVNLWATFCDEQSSSSRCAYFVMELATGGDLQGLIQRIFSTLPSPSSSPSVPISLVSSSSSNHQFYFHWRQYSIPYYTSQLITAVDFLHSKGIIHCDLKPHNILLDASTGLLRLTDFGCSSYIKHQEQHNDHDSQTHSSSYSSSLFPRGTSQYSSPEILRAESPSSLTVAVDYWSVGCIFYAMLHGQSPFTRDTEALTVQAVFDYVIKTKSDDCKTYSSNDSDINATNTMIPTGIGDKNDNDNNLQNLSLYFLHAVPKNRTKFWITSREKKGGVTPLSRTKNIILPVPNWKDEIETTTLRDGNLGWGVFQL